MSKIGLLITGVAIGFIGAHFVNQTSGGRRFFDQVNRGVREFSDAVAAGYRDAETFADTTTEENAR